MAVGSWLASCAAISQSGTTIDRFDPAATTHPLWAQRFSEFATTGAFVSATGNASTVQKTINRFVPGEPWLVRTQNLTYFGDYAKISIEFMAGATVVLAVAMRPPTDFSNVVFVGNSLDSVAAKSTSGANPNVNGVLTASLDGVRYVPSEAQPANTSAFFHAKDLSSVTALRFTVSAKTGYTAALSNAAFGFVQILGRLKGAVTGDAGSPVARTIRAVREDTGALAGTAVSDGTTGAYLATTEYAGAHTLIAYPGAGESLPALVLRGVVPV